MNGWNDCRVLVTGAGGFIGSHLVEALVNSGARVRALVHYHSSGSLGWLKDLGASGTVEIIRGDIRDSSFCQSLMENIDIVFHLAALIAIPYSYSAPQSYVDTNVLGTLNLCDAARRTGVSRFIHTSTSEVYGSALQVPISEEHPLQPQSPYSASKIAADSIALSYFHSFNLPVSVARPFNTFGPRQSARAVIPTIITQLLWGQKLSLGSLYPTRDFNYVTDTVRGLMAVGLSPQCIGTVTNIGSGYEISIGSLVKEVSTIMGVAVDEASLDTSRLRPEGSEVHRLLADNKKLLLLTEWKPQFEGIQGFRQALKITIDWFQVPENLQKYAKGYAI